MPTMTHPALAGTTTVVSEAQASAMTAAGWVPVDVPRIPLGTRPGPGARWHRHEAVISAADASSDYGDRAEDQLDGDLHS